MLANITEMYFAQGIEIGGFVRLFFGNKHISFLYLLKKQETKWSAQ